ncbi:MAG: tRNA lysidine(34) synthetase TilS [Sulfurospirillum sp.]|nr:tRNA lysidine(34) synthetase TilS [Sulfurospirillum sp.]MBL0703388.1 tRNA lysidine(34) synthetase TilS [Sulfurospirillum sp.]
MLQLPKLSFSVLKKIKKSKNLLAFSAGSDSSALFFILKALHVEFDIALLNYQTKKQSLEEQEYAKYLAKKFNKKCYIFTCKLKTSNFEHNAREVRYNFFEQIIEKHSYNTLLTAHHLNDKLEWFLMQLSRGAGAVELSGMSEIEDSEYYKTVRPLLHVDKKEILNFLHVNKIKYFLDSSNSDKKHFRNKIREEFASSFCKQFSSGIKKSFEYLEYDKKRLLPREISREKKLYILNRNEDDLLNIRGIDRVVKKLGVLLSKSSRDEIIKTKNCVVSSRVAIAFSFDKIYICPAITITMDKKFKETCRVAKIPPKIRPYMYKEGISIL